MDNSNNSALSKDTIFGAKNQTNINSVLNNSSILEEISISSLKKALTSKLLTPRKAMQVLSNLEAVKGAIEIFNKRNVAKQAHNIR